MSESGIIISKKALRKQVSDRLKHISLDSIKTQSTLITETVRSLPIYKNATNVGMYMHMDVPESPRKRGSIVEVQTDVMIRNALLDGKRLFLPRIVPLFSLKEDQRELMSASHQTFLPSQILKMIHVPDEESVRSLKVEDTEFHKFSLKEPSDGADAFDFNGLDLLIVPGLGFTIDGKRLGRGKGFYDNFIKLHRKWSANCNKKMPELIGISLQQQIIDQNSLELPMEEHDEIIDTIIVEDKVYSSRS
ncbi:hypothetical protein V1511DRAFT_53381 [Dipodascopsis uninucleata]